MNNYNLEKAVTSSSFTVTDTKPVTSFGALNPLYIRVDNSGVFSVTLEVEIPAVGNLEFFEYQFKGQDDMLIARNTQVIPSGYTSIKFAVSAVFRVSSEQLTDGHYDMNLLLYTGKLSGADTVAANESVRITKITKL